MFIKLENATLPVQLEPRPASALSVYLGEVLEVSSADHPNRLRVCWSLTGGRICERWVSYLHGLSFESGDRVLLQRPANDPQWLVTGVVSTRRSFPNVAKVDGQRILIEGKDEIELRCGEASITLRRNGRLVIRGAYVETRAKGINRIKGGAVLIN